jgi:hypothetical protein
MSKNNSLIDRRDACPTNDWLTGKPGNWQAKPKGVKICLKIIHY